MSDDEARALLTENKIAYVFDGPEEKYSRKTPKFYPDLLELCIKIGSHHI